MADRTRQRILLTGAAGTIGSALRASLRRDGRTIRAFDVAPLAEAAPGIAAEELRQGDMRSMEDVRRAVAGCDAVVHLAGIPREAPFEEILATNIGGLQHLLEACRQEGCRRVVFASSNHAIGFYPVGEPVRMDQPPRPDTYYGFSKATGELLARLYFDRFGIESCSIRIGTFGDRPTSGRLLRTLVTPRDLSQL
ncbi:MAG: NAD(P)-dependent oxidoreductase, partial [Candidatus Dormiibacterota bacterium]